ncbi:unnamed protein product [Prunus armeniaca]|uniref:Uncharacterized protein n=1 Tax=Prunus armeniaca TaxID=36596 RepID=A0A6J5TN35_PRUAR|nr:unnamed protein product [Prunus armeniaca]
MTCSIIYASVLLAGSKQSERLELSNMNKAYGRNDQWISLIMRCVSSVSFAVMLNGKVGSQFCPSRGLRNGTNMITY